MRAKKLPRIGNAGFSPPAGASVHRIILEPKIAHVHQGGTNLSPDGHTVIELRIHKRFDPVGGVVGCALQPVLFDQLVGDAVDGEVGGYIDAFVWVFLVVARF